MHTLNGKREIKTSAEITKNAAASCVKLDLKMKIEREREKKGKKEKKIMGRQRHSILNDRGTVNGK